MPSGMAGVATLLIAVVTLYWIVSSDALERLWEGVTTGRALSLGGFVGGLVWGNVVIKMVVGLVGGVATLSLGGVLDLGPMQFALMVAGIIGLLMYTREDDDD